MYTLFLKNPFLDRITLLLFCQPRNSPNDEKYTLPAKDSQDTTLSEQQCECFNDTKVVDKDCDFMAVYHGTIKN